MEKRFFAYIDILGFEALSKTEPDKVSRILKAFVSSQWHFVQGDQTDYGMIYFSDTIIIYYKHHSQDLLYLMDVCHIAHKLTIDMLCMNVPVRGVINYGELNIEPDNETGIELFWGRGLIDSYHAESDPKLKKEFVGIYVLPEAFGNIDGIKKVLTESDLYSNTFYLDPSDQTVYLNHFPLISDMEEHFGVDEIELHIHENQPDISQEMKAYKSLQTNEELHRKNEPVGGKYSTALNIAHSLIYHDISSYLDRITD
jgi:hypothetical protein